MRVWINFKQVQPDLGAQILVTSSSLQVMQVITATHLTTAYHGKRHEQPHPWGIQVLVHQPSNPIRVLLVCVGNYSRHTCCVVWTEQWATEGSFTRSERGLGVARWEKVSQPCSSRRTQLNNPVHYNPTRCTFTRKTVLIWTRYLLESGHWIRHSVGQPWILWFGFWAKPRYFFFSDYSRPAPDNGKAFPCVKAAEAWIWPITCI